MTTMRTLGSVGGRGVRLLRHDVLERGHRHGDYRLARRSPFVAQTSHTRGVFSFVDEAVAGHTPRRPGRDRGQSHQDVAETDRLEDPR